MPYTEAVINETLRKSSALPVGVPHMTSRDTKLGGYDIPKVKPKLPCQKHMFEYLKVRGPQLQKFEISFFVNSAHARLFQHVRHTQ